MAAQPSPEPPADFFVQADAFTRENYRDVYAAIDPTSPHLSQAGKVTIITGASRGIGREAFAVSFARAGAKAIVLLARSVADLSQTEREIKAINPSVETLPLSVDVSDEQSVNDAFINIKEKFGTADILINNAGKLEPGQLISEVDPSVWWSDIHVNLLGTFHATQAFIRLIGPNPTRKPTIINVSSAAAYGILPGISAYSLSKLAILQFSSYIAAENPSITSVCLNPGMIATNMGLSLKEIGPFLKDTSQLGGGAAVWLASGDKAWLSGRFVSANWDVVELEKRKEEIVKADKLKLVLRGEFGIQTTVHLAADPETYRS